MPCLTRLCTNRQATCCATCCACCACCVVVARPASTAELMIHQICLAINKVFATLPNTVQPYLLIASLLSTGAEPESMHILFVIFLHTVLHGCWPLLNQQSTVLLCSWGFKTRVLRRREQRLSMSSDLSCANKQWWHSKQPQIFATQLQQHCALLSSQLRQQQ